MNVRHGKMHASIDRAINLNFQSTATRLINAVADTVIERQRRVRQFHFKAVRRSAKIKDRISFPPGLPSRTFARTVSSELVGFCF